MEEARMILIFVLFLAVVTVMQQLKIMALEAKVREILATLDTWPTYFSKALDRESKSK